MYGSNKSPHLKHVFKFYKSYDYNEQNITMINGTLRSCLKMLNIPIPKSDAIISYLPSEDFFIIENAFSCTDLDELLYESISKWYMLPTKVSNIEYSHCGTDGSDDLYSSFSKLRWITLGYHYQWTERCYIESHRGEFPKSLNNAALRVVDILQQTLESNKLDVSDHDVLIDRCKTFAPEASIVNYYQTKTTMGFHSDDAEFITDAPLISISLGPPALFLLETTSPIVPNPPFAHCETLDEPGMDHILPVILKHGDVVVMAGKSRLAQHAVPHIFFENSINHPEVESCAIRVGKRRCTEFAKDNVKSGHSSDLMCDQCTNFSHLLTKTRVNINIRQVLPPNTNFSDFILNCDKV